MLWRCRNRIIDLTRPIVMGVLNVTPDSFSDGGRYSSPQAALERAAEMGAQGAAVIAVAVAAGACIVNDVYALRAAGARAWAARAEVGVCLMHMQGEPRTMQKS